ncbi:MAG: hypothetical protein GX808_01755, partial [Syntrophomonadaceae bacterium]|nr:hypothetical protein [Syntrophomonadaceae bacterium]
ANSPVTITLAAADDASKTTVYTIIFQVYVPPTEITAFDAIPDVAAGTAGSATYADAAAVIAALPTTVTANANTVNVPVTTWVDTDAYDPAAAGSYTFTATLGAIPAGYANSGGYTATVEVVVAAAPVSVVVNTLGTEGNLTTGTNAYNIQDNTSLGLWSFAIAKDKLPAAFAGATGYKLVIGSTEYTLDVNMFNSNLYQYDVPDTFTDDQIRNGSLVAIF